jgi:Flp pilus assembly pilin Flp
MAKEARRKQMNNFLATLWSDDSGQDLAEYVLLLVLIAVVVAVAIIAFREAIVNGFTRATTQLNDGVSGA